MELESNAEKRVSVVWQKEEPVIQQEKEWFIKAPWGRICIVAWGNCLDPPILVCHGERDSTASFKPVMKYLPGNFYYVGIEFPGQGKSDPYPPGLGISAWDLVYVIEHVRRHFRWTEFGYMAHSYACIIGRLYNATHPGVLNRVIEFDPIKFGFPSEIDDFASWYDRNYTKYFDNYSKLNAPKEEGPAYSWEEAIRKVVKLRGLTPETARATIERWSESAGKDQIRFTYDQRSKSYLVPPFTPEQVKELYESLPTPTLAILAQDTVNHDLYRPTSFMLKDYGNYRVRFVSGGHDVHVVHPDRVAIFVVQFLKYGLEGLDRKAKL
ncbi:hypothetical protein O0L34_g12199 [Tuta absoluta]|nr:hypothetical protein O0L34_g12199 [Tuta absoluta]